MQLPTLAILKWDARIMWYFIAWIDQDSLDKLCSSSTCCGKREQHCWSYETGWKLRPPEDRRCPPVFPGPHDDRPFQGRHLRLSAGIQSAHRRPEGGNGRRHKISSNHPQRNQRFPISVCVNNPYLGQPCSAATYHGNMELILLHLQTDFVFRAP